MNDTLKEQKLLTARQIWASKRIYWITSYKALLKYISKDYIDIFKPILTGSRSGTRYYIKDENLQNFIKKFETNQLH
ncbi:TPA: hypothetical protein DIU22_02125 [Candidatus Woesebacteria bacterium]|nr:hypothetical protein [Candidatus Woesebacteria bacterium]